MGWKLEWKGNSRDFNLPLLNSFQFENILKSLFQLTGRCWAVHDEITDSKVNGHHKTTRRMARCLNGVAIGPAFPQDRMCSAVRSARHDGLWLAESTA
jgi:Golgi nucleoside diphosphatase